MSNPETPDVRIAAATATYRREEQLARLLRALANSAQPISAGVFVADNASSDTTRDVCASAPIPSVWIPRDSNNGPGPAWNTAIAQALEDPDVTHVLVLDDDVDPPPHTVGTLLGAIEQTGSAAAAPLLFDEGGRLWGFPEPRQRELRAVIRRVHTPEECRSALGASPHAFCWATGACMLYARKAFESRGMFREDFWMLGEDLEFSMRVASAPGGVFTAQVSVPHLPPPPLSAAASRVAHRAKFLALLQNLSFLAFHSEHSAHLRSYLPGNFLRYARTEGWQAGTLFDGLSAFRLGAMRGQPAGTPDGALLRERARRRMEEDGPE